MNELSPEDEALLRWSGELEGSAPPELDRELCQLASSLRSLPQDPVG